MTNYILHGVKLSAGQAEKIYKALKNNEGVTIRLSKSDLDGQFKIPLTKRQFNKIAKSDANGLDLKLSALQLKHLGKSGGLLPLLSLIPLIAGVAGGVVGLASRTIQYNTIVFNVGIASVTSVADATTMPSDTTTMCHQDMICRMSRKQASQRPRTDIRF